MKNISIKRILSVSVLAIVTLIVTSTLLSTVGLDGANPSLLFVPLISMYLASRNKSELESRNVFILNTALAGFIFGVFVGVLGVIREGRPETLLFITLFMGLTLLFTSGLLGWLMYALILKRWHPLGNSHAAPESDANGSTHLEDTSAKEDSDTEAN